LYRLASLATGRLANNLKYLLKALDLPLRFVAMLEKPSFAFLRLSSASDFRQRLQDLLFRVIDILERVEEEIVQCLLSSHCVLRDDWCALPKLKACSDVPERNHDAASVFRDNDQDAPKCDRRGGCGGQAFHWPGLPFQPRGGDYAQAGKTGFQYCASDGRRLTNDEEIARLNSLAIPPAYLDVIIPTDAQSHLEEVGIDTRGRKQYRYHLEWQAERERAKFDRLADFGMRLPDIRERVDRDLRARWLSIDNARATVVWILDNLYIRIGNAGYAETNKSNGLTTPRNRHVKIEGATVRFRFKGKSGKEWDLAHPDHRIANVVRRLQELPGQQLFKYLCDDGDCRHISSQDVNDCIREVEGDKFTFRQFRTWGATCLAVAALAPLDTASSDRAFVSQMNEAIDLVAAKLVNTSAVCRSSYIHTAAFGDFRAHRLRDVFRRKTTSQRLLRWMAEEESAVVHWLKSQRGE